MAGKKTRLMAKITWLGEFRVVLEEKDEVAKFVIIRRRWEDGRYRTHKVEEYGTLTGALVRVADEIRNGR